METADSIKNTMLDTKQKAIDFAWENGPKILSALVILIAGFIVAGWIDGMLLRSLNKRDMEPPVKMLISRIVKLLVLGFALIIALGTAGVNVMALVAGIGVAGVGVGLAMQGVLSNLFAGLTIIFTKPFRVGEYIELAGVEGQVTNIEIFSTKLQHADQSRVVIPNRKIVGEILHNYGQIRQLDLSVSVGYNSNLSEVLALVQDILARNQRVLKTPAPVIGVGALGNSAINIIIKPWTTVGDFGPASNQIYQAIIDGFRANKVEIPFPIQEIRVLNQVGAA